MIQSQLTFERNRDFLSLSLADRSLLLRHTVKYTSTLGTIFTVREGHLFDSSSFSKAMNLVFRPSTTIWMARAVEQLNLVDSIWMKLVVAIIAFSTFTSSLSKSTVFINDSTARRISCVQDNYIELAWRYLRHKHNDQQTVLCFSSLIRCLFLVNQTIREAEETQLFAEIIGCVVQATEQLWQLNQWLKFFSSLLSQINTSPWNTSLPLSLAFFVNVTLCIAHIERLVEREKERLGGGMTVVIERERERIDLTEHTEA